MGKILWLASYPKSGNTWMRALLTNYRRDPTAPVDINALEGGPIASSRTWFDTWAGVESSALDEALIQRLRPSIYRCMARAAPEERLILKVHDAWMHTDRGEALFPADVTAGVVYLLRNPLDLVGSCAHHWNLSLQEMTALLCDPHFALAYTPGEMSDQLCQHLLTWSGHLRSWLDESGLPVHVVRYEDLLRAPEAVFGEVVRFCGLPFDTARVRRAVAFADFAELQGQEQEKGFCERSTAVTGPFFRRGRADLWREEMPLELTEQILAQHGEMMRWFGYVGADGRPV
jgi:hypothetical protein